MSKRILEKKNFKCKNKILQAQRYKDKNYDGKPQEVWKIMDKKKYIDSVDYCPSSMFGEDLKFYGNGIHYKSFEDYISYWRKKYIFPNIRVYDEYYVDVYGISQKDFEEMKKNIKLLLDAKEQVHYNDEHGVGYFVKTGKTYMAHHFRWGTERTEKMTIDKIMDFLRDFFDIGYSYDKIDNWDY